jgi:hypothetical protein
MIFLFSQKCRGKGIEGSNDNHAWSIVRELQGNELAGGAFLWI